MISPDGIRPLLRFEPPRAGGFTLIEVVVVLVVITVLAATVAPALVRPAPELTDLEAGVDRFEILFRQARDSAVRSARPVTIVLDSVSGQLWFDETGQVPDSTLGFTMPDGVRIAYLLPRTLFTFTPAGSAVGDSLKLVSNSGETCLVTVDPWNGNVRVR